MAIMGFGLAGAFIVGATVASHVGPALQPAKTAPQGAVKVPASLAAQLQGYGTKKWTSTNWGGYADNATGGTILEAYAEWIVPTISCANHDPSLSDQWGGIDGFNDGTVEQGGTYEYCVSTTSGPYYWTWYEFYPYESIISVSSSVAAGDIMNAYVLYNPHVSVNGLPGIYTIVVEDLNNNASSFMYQGDPATCTTGGACQSGADTSAECISESLVGQGYYLAKTGVTTFYNCDAEINGYYSGLGGLPHGAHATINEITTLGYVSGLTQQSISKLTTYDLKNDHFTITWKRYS